MPEYLELESGGTFLLLEDGELLELDEGAVFVAGNASTFTTRTRPASWSSATAGAVSIRQRTTVLATASNENTWTAPTNSTWH